MGAEGVDAHNVSANNLYELIKTSKPNEILTDTFKFWIFSSLMGVVKIMTYLLPWVFSKHLIN